MQVAVLKRKASDAILKGSMALAAGIASVPVLAQTVDPADAAIADAKTKMVGYAVAVVGAMIAFWAVKRAGQKMGWW
ncbi:hypothetical protein LJR069_002599 [Variovorax paradoxus]|uniref:hypothetical protein n=1 Tax=Variovorax paradoxus TaxID=34073 RepID=UPI003ECF7282